jgi:hypothetical protein
MSALANAFLFTQFNLDSGALTQLGSVAHRFAEPGDYRGVVFNGELPVETFILHVSDSIAALQTNIDLAKAGRRNAQTGCCSAGLQVYSVHSSGYVVFHVSVGGGGYFVTVNKIGKPDAFDSRILRPGDLFTAILLRPGTYAARAKDALAGLTISVSYPAGKGKLAHKTSARVEYSGGRFRPSHVALKPAQGIVFDIEQDTRIQIALEKPEDGPL